MDDLDALEREARDDDPIVHLTHAVDFDGWLRIDAAERSAGADRGRERTKLVECEEMLMHAKQEQMMEAGR